MSTRLSKSALEKFRSCPKCFWIDKNMGLKQPEGIRSGLPMGMDRVLKEHYDRHREVGNMPSELVGQVPIGLNLYSGNRISMKDLRNWRKGLNVIVDAVELSTALDDLLFDKDLGVYVMIDYKTKAKATDEAATQQYYGVQADCYDLALVSNGYPTPGLAYFAYYYPVTVGSGTTPASFESGHSALSMAWACQVIKIRANHDRAKDLLLRAAKCLSGPMPDPGPDCEYCSFVTERNGLVKVAA